MAKFITCRFRVYAVLAIVSLALSLPCSAEDNGYVPPDGFVPPSRVANQIAEAVLVPIYGRANIEREKPFETRLDGDVWTVEGTSPPHTFGGVFTIKISRLTGEILYLIHTR
jgi:hypothetical protein